MKYSLIGCSAFIIWGTLPLFFKLMNHFSPAEIMGIRVYMSFLVLGGVIVFQKRLISIYSELKKKNQILLTFVASILIGLNWFLFVYAIDTNQVLETSFGYFISPIISIILGALVLNEKLTKPKKFATVLFIVSVSIQLLDFKTFPWIALIISTSFSTYGLVKKYITLNTNESVFIEMFFISLIYLMYQLFSWDPNPSIDYLSSTNLNLYVLAGLLSIAPMLLFTQAIKHLEISTVGFIQFISPSVQFILAAFVFHENLSPYKWTSFSIIWAACFLVAYGAFSGRSNIRMNDR